MQLPNSNQLPPSMLSGLSVGKDFVRVTYRYITLGNEHKQYYMQDFNDIQGALNFIVNELKNPLENGNDTN